ncbi:MAG: hypothetical protein RLZZ628_3408 [Bacteroidota bacterium]
MDYQPFGKFETLSIPHSIKSRRDAPLVTPIRTHTTPKNPVGMVFW